MGSYRLETLSHRPRVLRIQSFIDAAEVDALKALAGPNLQQVTRCSLDGWAAALAALTGSLAPPVHLRRRSVSG
eukprot:SAG31_NODE_13533_length_863_cov_1.149215_1_plen_74_part_00